ncbi:MAG: nucleotidyltransferase family protein [Acidimicrobiales bacterium]
MTDRSPFDLARAVAAWGTRTGLVPPTAPVDDETWRTLFAEVTSQRITGLLSWAIAAGDWPATEDQAAQVVEAHQSWMATTVLLERLLLRTARSFDDHGIPFQVLKGSAVAHLDYEDPSLRCFGDVDLLIPGSHIEAARDLLLAEGGRRAYPEPRPGFDRRFTKGLAITTPDRFEIDLHRTLTAGPFGLALDLDALMADPDHFVLGGRSVAALGRPQRFLHACIHAMLGSATPRLVPLRDLVETAPATATEVEAVRALAERSSATAVVGRAVAAARAELGWHPPLVLAAWAEAVRETARDRRWLAGYLGAQRAYATQALVAVEAVPGGPATKAAYLWAVLLPRDASRGDALVARWQRGARAVRRRVQRTP